MYVKLLFENFSVYFRHKEYLILNCYDFKKFESIKLNLENGFYETQDFNYKWPLEGLKKEFSEVGPCILFEYEDCTYKNWVAADSTLLTRTDKAGNKITTNILYQWGDGFTYVQDGKIYVWYMPDNKREEFVPHMYREVIEFVRYIYVPFSLGIAKVAHSNEKQKIANFLMSVKRLGVRLPRWISEMILKSSFQTYEEIVE